jgi:hypothetical protein
MQIEHKKENEKFFTLIIQTLGEGGVYGWVSEKEFMTRRGDKLECTQRAYNQLKHIVTEEYLVNNFVII